MLSDTAPWHQVSDLLETACDALPPGSWRPTIGLVHTADQQDQEYLQSALWEILKDHQPESMKALMHWHATQEWPELSPQAVYQLQLIHSRCLIHLASVAGVGDKSLETMFGFPDGSPAEAALWMTTMWWTECGFGWFLQELARRSSRLPYDLEDI